jgi:hypothetical protein
MNPILTIGFYEKFINKVFFLETHEKFNENFLNSHRGEINNEKELKFNERISKLLQLNDS